MTMPQERTRALRWAGEFLREIQSNPDADPKLKRQALFILRHFPEPHEIELWARYCGRDQVTHWLEPEESESVTQLKGMFSKTDALHLGDGSV